MKRLLSLSLFLLPLIISAQARAISGTIEYDNQVYASGEIKIGVWKNPAVWPYPGDMPVAEQIITGPIDFTTPVPFNVDDPDLLADCCYRIGFTFDANNDSVADAENWWDMPLDLTDGSIAGMTIALMPPGGFSFDFGATNSTADVNFTELDGTSNLTIEMFINLHAGGSPYTIFKRDNWGELRFDNGSGKLIFDLNTIGTVDASVDFPASQWQHLAAVYDGSEMRLYVNGHREAAGNASGALSNPANPLRFGAGMDGSMDEIRISNTARYDGSNVPVPTEPFFPDGNTRILYHCDEGGGSILMDASGNGYNANIPGGTPTWEPFEPWMSGGFNLWFMVAGDTINLDWMRWAGADFSEYQVRRSNSPGVTTTSDLIFQTADTNETHYADIQPAGQWYYKVFVMFSGDPVGESNEIFVDMDNGGGGRIRGNVRLDQQIDTQSHQIYMFLWQPGQDPDNDTPVLVRNWGEHSPFDIGYEFNGPQIISNSGPYIIRTYYDVNNNASYEEGEPAGQAQDLYTPASAELNNINIDLTTTTATGIIDGMVRSPLGGSGNLYLGIWYGGDPTSGEPDYGIGPQAVTFNAPDDSFHYHLEDIAIGSGYYLGVKFDQNGSANSGADSCDAGQDLWGEIPVLNITGTLNDLDIILEECSLPELPVLDVQTDSLTFAALETDHSFSVENSGTGTLYWTAAVTYLTTSSGYLTIDPTSGSLSESGFENVSVGLTAPTGLNDQARILLNGYSDSGHTTLIGTDTVAVQLAAWTNSGPQISTGELSTDPPVESQDLTVSVLVNSVNEIAASKLFYWSGGDPQVDSLDMTLVDQGTGQWAATIPGAAISSSGLVLRVKSRDAYNFTTVSNAQTVSVRFAGLNVPDLTAATYTMLSAPGALDNTALTGVLDELGPYDDTQWRIFRWVSGAYTEAAGQFDPGKAYWLITRNNESSLTTGAGISTPLTGFDLTLKSGWNMIGNPYTFPMDITESGVSLSNAAVEPVLYHYDGSGYTTTTILTPGAGYWIWSGSSVDEEMSFDPLSIGSLSGRIMAADPAGWTAALAASIGNVNDNASRFGSHPEASRQWDARDRHEPPVIGDYISLSFENRDWSQSAGDYNTDIRPVSAGTEQWPVMVRTNVAGTGRLRLLEAAGLPAHLEAWLVDPVNREVFNLRTTTVPFVSTGSEAGHRYRLIVGDPAAVAREIESLDYLPREFHLAQNMPNPFNPTTTIQIAMAAPGRVNLTVYNLLGEEVTTLLAGDRLEAGYHRAFWNGRNSRGLAVPSGVYFYRLSVTGETGAGLYQMTRKMILVK